MKKENEIDFNGKKVENIKFAKVKYAPTVESHLPPKIYVDNAIDETSLVKKIQDNDFNNYILTNINSITLNIEAVTVNLVITKAYVDQFQQANERSRRDFGLYIYNESSDLVKNNQDNNFIDYKLTVLDSVSVDTNPCLKSELVNKKFLDDELDRNTIVRFNQTFQVYLKESFGK